MSAYFVVTSLVNDQVYAAAGLDVAEAKKAAQENRHYHDKLRQALAARSSSSRGGTDRRSVHSASASRARPVTSRCSTEPTGEFHP